MTADLEIYVRDSTRNTISLHTRWSQLTLVQRRNDVGRWTVTVSDSSDAGDLTAGRGIIIRRGGTTLASGWLDSRGITRTGAATEFTLSGWDDTIYLTDTLCWPKPSAAVTAQTDAHHVLSGAASTRIAGYWNTNVVTRLTIPGAVTSAPPALGASGTTRARFHTLLELAQLTCGRAVNFAVVQRDSDRALPLTFTLPRDLRLSVQFTPQMGTVTGWTSGDTAPTATRIIGGAGGEGEARGFRQVIDTAAEVAYANVRRPERFRDRRDLALSDGTWPTQLVETLNEEIVEHRRRSSFTMSVTDTAGMRYGVDYLVGDQVRAYPEPGVPLDDLVEEVTVAWDGDGGEQATVTVGPPGDPDAVDALRERDTRRKVQNLEAGL